MPQAGVQNDTARDRARASPDALAEHGGVLLALARSIVVDEAEARDLVQVTFEIALRRLDDLREPSALRSWLCSILAHEAFRALRRLRRLVRLDAHVADVTFESPDATDDLALRMALRTLPRRTRATVVLHYMVGLSVRETAGAMGVSENTVKTLLRLGMARLREELVHA
jgi:RNA polymerase sigma factor (sigma-70 family)